MGARGDHGKLTVHLLSRGWLLSTLAMPMAGCDLAPDLMDPASGAPAPDFTLPDLEGHSWQLSEFRGQTLLINFWATWCAPCRREMPALDRLHQRMAGAGFHVIGIHVGPNTAIDSFLKETPVSFPILVDADLRLANWKVPAIPATFLIDAEGKVRYSAFGEREWDAPEAVEFFTALID